MRAVEAFVAESQGRVLDRATFEDPFQPSAGMQVLADLLTVLCGLLALRVVRRTTARQQERATRLAATGAIARR